MSDKIAVQLRVDRGSNFAGEICGFSPEISSGLIARGEAYALDTQGKPIITDPPKRKAASVEPAGEEPELQVSADDENMEFVLDGLDGTTINALLTAGIRSPDDVRNLVLSGKKLTNLPGIGPSRAKMLEEMYCDMEEESDAEDEPDAEDEEIDDDDDDQPQLLLED